MGSIASVTETFGGGDYRWLATARGTAHPKSGTFDVSSLDGDTETEVLAAGRLLSGLPVAYNSESGLFIQADDEDTVDTLAGFVYHDVSLAGDNDVTIAVLTDATIVAEFVPGEHDLVDGRYTPDTIAPAGGS
jgi:hypothetical protein